MSFLSKFDIFGHKVNFTFKRHVNYKTIFGGICSIFLIVIIIYFAAMGLIRVSSREVISFSTDYTEFEANDGFNAG